MAFDPSNPNAVHVRTPTNGAWRSFDAGSTRERISDVIAGIDQSDLARLLLAGTGHTILVTRRQIKVETIQQRRALHCGSMVA
jgi:hypothetical protein